MQSKQVKIEILDPTTGAKDATPLVESFSILHSALRHGRQWEIVFADSDWAFWEPYVSGQDPLQVRLTFSKSATPETTGWLTLYVDVSESDFSRQYLHGTIRGGDALLNTAIKQETRAYPLATVDTMVSRIAAQHGFVADTVKMEGQRTWYQLYETDFAFLKYLLNYTATASGRGDVWFWFDNGTLHYKPFDFKAPSKDKYLLGGVDDRVAHAPVSFYGGQVDREGGRRVGVYTFDVTKNQGFYFEVGATSAGGPALSTYVPRLPSGGFFSENIAAADLALVRAAARAQWAKYGMRYFGITLKTKGALSVSVGDMIEVDFLKEVPAKGAFVRGRYPVFEVEHKYTKDKRFTTNITGYRRESEAGQQAAGGANVSSSRGKDAYLTSLQTGAQGLGQTTKVSARPLG